MSLPPARLSSLLEDADPWRGPPLDRPGLPYKEWQHFIVFGPGWTALFNLSLDETGTGTLTTVFCAGEWQGHVARCRRPEVRPGRIDATFDRAGMRFHRGNYQIWQHGEGLRMEVTLQPRAVPSLSHHIRLGPDAHLSWCLVPRLSASGWIEQNGQRLSFADRIAYHDHNWGRFRWGGDFSWEWGCGVPDDTASPWTVVFARMNDRARRQTTATSVFLLRDGAHVRYFRNAEARFTSEAGAELPPCPRVPAAAALLLPDRDRDVPRWTRFAASRDGDHLIGEIEAITRGQLLMPSETDVRRVVRLNEVHTRVEVRGQVAGEAVSFEGPGLLEVVCG